MPFRRPRSSTAQAAFAKADFRRLAEQLAAIAGGFVLSINDAPETRAIFAAFDQETIGVTYTASEGDAKKASELIVSKSRARRQPAFDFD